jgi:hypothetical protein
MGHIPVGAARTARGLGCGGDECAGPGRVTGAAGRDGVSTGPTVKRGVPSILVLLGVWRRRAASVRSPSRRTASGAGGRSPRSVHRDSRRPPRTGGGNVRNPHRSHPYRRRADVPALLEE